MTTTRIPIAFAQDGTRSPIDTLRSDGVINLTQGYTDDYARRLGTDPAAKAVERDKMNWLLNLITSNLIDWQNSAVPQWLAQVEYAPPALVRYSPTSGADELIYRAISEPPVGTPPTNTTYWEEMLPISVLRDLIPMPYRGIVSASTNFNSFTSNGTWVFSANDIGSYPNGPAGAIGGMLETRLTTSGAQTLLQRYTGTNGGRYARGRDASGAWSPWITETYPVPIAQGGTGATTAADARTNLGLGTAATYNVGSSGAFVPLLSTSNIWSAGQTFSSGNLTIRGAGTGGTQNGGSLLIGTDGSYLNYSGTQWVLYNGSNGNTITFNATGNVWTSGNFDPGTKYDKTGGLINGSATVGSNLTVNAEFRVGTTANARVFTTGDTVYWDSRGTTGSSTPNGYAQYRAITHYWTNQNGVVVGSIAGDGTLTANSINAGWSANAAINIFDRNDSNRYWSLYCQSGTFNWWHNAFGNLMYLTTAGRLVAVSLGSGSDPRLKDIEGPLPYGLAEVRRITTHIGRYKEGYSNDRSRRMFFDAINFHSVMPEAVDLEMVEHDGEKYAGIAWEQVGPPLYNAVQELADMVDALKAEVAALKKAG